MDNTKSLSDATFPIAILCDIVSATYRSILSGGPFDPVRRLHFETLHESIDALYASIRDYKEFHTKAPPIPKEDVAVPLRECGYKPSKVPSDYNTASPAIKEGE